MKNAIKLNTIFAVISTCFSMSTFSQRIAKLIEKSESFPFNETITPEQIKNLGFKKGSYDIEKSKEYIRYYYAPASSKDGIHYSVKYDTDGKESTVKLDLPKDSLKEKYSGTVILLHGFRSSKEFMLYSAQYFRFLGFQVVAPDLLGHGESNSTKKYGVGDSELINKLIDALISKGDIKGKPLYIVGNSMGALTALYISAMRSDLSGIILLAPMVPFDQAVYNYGRLNHPILSRIIPENKILKGANLALEQSGIEPSDTNILPLLCSSRLPILLISSPSDLIAPYDNYIGLDQSNINLVKIPNRSHPSISTIGNIEHEAIISWLNKL
ncbi:alpha/beta hydrolase [Microbulbifer sp. TRSA007]|uniref:alpha/beta hydrolase n=1 Tax=Microbulbifer sp. TRSA007 TaxID=3243384 RepID=UPI004039E810